MTQLSYALRIVFALAVLAAAGGTERVARAADPITVLVDQATLIKLPERVGTIVVGNPLIADITVQAGGTMVVTGKGFGTTNLIVLDRQGSVLMEKQVQVDGPQDKSLVVVFRGVTRETYSCLPHCERRITLGDNPDYFNDTLAQSGARNAQAAGTPTASK